MAKKYGYVTLKIKQDSRDEFIEFKNSMNYKNSSTLLSDMVHFFIIHNVAPKENIAKNYTEMLDIVKADIGSYFTRVYKILNKYEGSYFQPILTNTSKELREFLIENESVNSEQFTHDEKVIEQPKKEKNTTSEEYKILDKKYQELLQKHSELRDKNLKIINWGNRLLQTFEIKSALTGGSTVTTSIKKEPALKRYQDEFNLLK